MQPKLIAFWILTGLIIASQGASGVLDLIAFEPIVAGMNKLGMPLYVLKILGVWKILGALCLAAPGLPRAKEWAYAGFFFDFSGAAACHLLNGDAIGDTMPSIIICCVLVGSYVLRPESRRLPGPAL